MVGGVVFAGVCRSCKGTVLPRGAPRMTLAELFAPGICRVQAGSAPLLPHGSPGLPLSAARNPLNSRRQA